MIPIADAQRLRHVPIVTVILLVSMTVIFLWQERLSPFASEQLVLAFGLNPAHLFGYRAPSSHMGYVPVAATLLTHAFLHNGWIHVLGNGLFFWIFGPAVENAIGPVRYTGLFLVSAAMSAIVQASMMIEQSQIHMIGASGAISGLIGAYLMLYPKGRLIVLVPVYIVVFKRYRWPSAVFIGIWFVLQLGAMFLAGTEDSNVAFLAHITGFVVGVVLGPVLCKADFPLFDRKR